MYSVPGQSERNRGRSLPEGSKSATLWQDALWVACL